MKKLNFTMGFVLAALSICLTIYIVKNVTQGSGEHLTTIALAALSGFASVVYFFDGVQTAKKEKVRMDKLSNTYKKLMALYDELKEDPKDDLSKNMFVKGVHEFSTDVFEILSGLYPQEMQEKANSMLNKLIERAAELM